MLLFLLRQEKKRVKILVVFIYVFWTSVAFCSEYYNCKNPILQIFDVCRAVKTKTPRVDEKLETFLSVECRTLPAQMGNVTVQRCRRSMCR